MPFCRICKAELSMPLLELTNVPAAAQNMPSTPQELSADKGVDLSICQCPCCGVIQHTAQPVAYYREVIRASGISEAMRQFRLQQFDSWVQRYDLKGKKVFEAGCGRGEYLELMNASGVKAFGTEAGAEACSCCQQKGLTVFKTFFEKGDEKLPDGPYDGFFILNFLEHIPDIPAFLAGIRNNLTAGAPCLIEIPNSDLMLSKAVITDFSIEHLYYFTQKTLCTILENNGFEIKNCQQVWEKNIISVEACVRPLIDLSPCKKVVNEISSTLKDFIRTHKKVAFWGCGHQTMTILSVAQLTSLDVQFVVDSSPKKQNCCTYTTHIPIVSPDILWKSDINAVIISCGGYSHEVLDTIRKKTGKRFVTAIWNNNQLDYDS